MQTLEDDCVKNMLSTNFKQSIDRYSDTFNEAIQQFLNDLQKSNDSMNTLLARLDFNTYYMPRQAFYI